MIQAESFSKKAWRPAFLLVEDETQVPVRSRKLGDKQIADVVKLLTWTDEYDEADCVRLRRSSVLLYSVADSILASALPWLSV